MRPVVVLATTVILVVASQSAIADTLRCGSSLIEVGSSEADVLAKCGQPTSKATITEPVWARAVNGNLYQSGTTQSQIWRYDRGPRQFPAILKITDGVLQSLEFDKSPRPSSQR